MTLLIIDGERRTAHQLVRDTLRRAILTGQIRGGERLVQADLAAQLQVSTTPVREALRDLAAEGLIELDAHRGAIVHVLSEREVEEIRRIRQLLEPEVMTLAVQHISEEELNRAEEIQRDADVERDPVALVDLNKAFHRVFNEASRSPRLAQIVSTLQDSGTPYMVAALEAGTRKPEDGKAQHRAILNAVRARDTEEAQRLALEHISYALTHAPDGWSTA